MTDTLTPLHALVRQQAERLEAAGVALGHGTATPFDEAAWLVLWQLGLPLDTDLDGPAQPTPTQEQLQQVDQLVTRRIQTRQPAAYLTREAWLQGVAFYVDERAIIPRSLIAETLADGSIDAFLHPETCHVLDLCTGNGSLAVLAALAWPDVVVEAADISTDALAVAAINVEKHGLQQRIRLLQSDGLANCTGPYDLILCNPPYVNAQSMAARIPGRARSCPGRRRRRHGFHPPAAGCRPCTPERAWRAGAGNRPRARPFRSSLPAPEPALARNQRRW